MPSPDLAPQSILNKARKDKFILTLTTPKCLQGLDKKGARYANHKSRLSVIPDKMQYSVYGAVVPQMSIPSQTLGKYGQNLKVSTHTRDAYEDVTVNYTIDNQFNNFWYIWSWLNILNDQRESMYDAHGVGTSQQISQHTGYKGLDEQTRFSHDGVKRSDTSEPRLLEDYQTDIVLFGLNEYNKETIKFTYTMAFPTNLGGVEYSYRDSSEIESTFSFSFSQLYIELLD
tara:strand:+ start:4950 stop:5636 length:687 start_codon:yes stop_codon:yes gene_type:complete